MHYDCLIVDDEKELANNTCEYLIMQNVLSFMPTITIGVLIGTIVSYFITNPYIGLMMRSFGIMKCTMVLPMDLMVITVVFLIYKYNNYAFKNKKNRTM